MQMLAIHGEQNCRVCFDGCSGRSLNVNGRRLVNDPGYWGAADPRILILGQSKGNTQVQTYAKAGFDKVAFSGIRDRLELILKAVSINLSGRVFENAFTEKETELGFASLLRCSLSDPSGKTSGSPVTTGMSDRMFDRWIGNCARRWLTQLNPRLRLVIFLGLTPRYVKGVMRHLKTLHADTFKQIGDVTATAAGVTWVFAQHPSRISENHYRRWVDAGPHVKRDAVTEAVVKALSGL